MELFLLWGGFCALQHFLEVGKTAKGLLGPLLLRIRCLRANEGGKVRLRRTGRFGVRECPRSGEDVLPYEESIKSVVRSKGGALATHHVR
jgi:hypothetical protein